MLEGHQNWVITGAYVEVPWLTAHEVKFRPNLGSVLNIETATFRLWLPFKLKKKKYDTAEKNLYISSVFMKDWCQVIAIYSYFETRSKPYKYVHKVYEECIQLTLKLQERKNSTF